ncbi:DUF723 domain-containing protein [Bacillus sp. XF8]|uniref:DUF723 domain-containing protein n=1 Tax=Bacillus sp. XF8 TaxID=2819289 RepID=UPI001AA0164A|nr:DUF723 domain-containing protein [Bacillus sp. XF8]MBO1583296.1 DUF723 domain-containing protein [Bacillus sp. XF8]
MAQRLSFEEVQAKFKERGYTLLETEYKNRTKKMAYICPQHPNEKLTISYNELRAGSGCRHCGIAKRGHSRKVTYAEVKAEFKKKGYELLETRYHNVSTKMRYRCNHHPDEIFTIRYRELKLGHGCPKCGKEKSGATRAKTHSVLTDFPKESKYTKEQRQEARQETSRLLDMYCYDCPNKDLPFIGEIEENCYKNCPHGIGLELRRCGAILAGEDADAVIERYKVRFEKERIDVNSRKEALVNE